AVFAIGTMAVDRRVGLIAAALLIMNPLYRLHARRAMADAPAEALIAATAALGLWAWRDILAGRSVAARALALALGGGVLGGLAVLAKLNGGLGLMILAAWAVLGLVLNHFSLLRRLVLAVATGASAIVAFAMFASLNPFLTAHPTGSLPPTVKPAMRDQR